MYKHGMGDVFQIEEGFTADKNISLLEEDFLPSLINDCPFLPWAIVLMQDKCPLHTRALSSSGSRDRTT